MTAWGHCRGHRIYWDPSAEVWRFEDGEPAPNWGGHERPCAACGRLPEHNGPDPCLGMLPGVRAACCGHGGP